MMSLFNYQRIYNTNEIFDFDGLLCYVRTCSHYTANNKLVLGYLFFFYPPINDRLFLNGSYRKQQLETSYHSKLHANHIFDEKSFSPFCNFFHPLKFLSLMILIYAMKSKCGILLSTTMFD